MNKVEPYPGRVKIGYCYRKRDEKHEKKRGSITPHAIINTRNFITVMGFTGIFQR